MEGGGGIKEKRRECERRKGEEVLRKIVIFKMFFNG